MALTIPFTFVAGTAAVAAEVNSNFSAIATWANNANIGTDSLSILQARTIPLAGAPTYAILSINQTSSNQAIYISNSGSESTLDIIQAGQLASGKGVIKITDNFTQTVSGANEFVMNLAANSTIPALLIKHGSVETLNLTKSILALETLFKPVIKTTAQRAALVAPPEGSVIYNSTNQELNVKQNSAWAPVGCPVGSVQMFAGASAPQGWLLCNGDVVPNGSGTVQGITADFSFLYSIVNTLYGVAGRLPDLRGLFVRGAGTHNTTLGGFTPSATLGTYQGDSTAVNGLSVATTNLSVLVPAIVGRAQDENDSDNERMVNNDANRITYNLNHSHTLTGDTETRPVNVALTYIIKY